jgi:hypothetical protein
MVDVFTRKLYAVPVKNKTIDSTTKALDKILTDNTSVTNEMLVDVYKQMVQQRLQPKKKLLARLKKNLFLQRLLLG